VEGGEGAAGKEAPMRVRKGGGRGRRYERRLRLYSPCLVVLDAPPNMHDHEQEAAAGSGETDR